MASVLEVHLADHPLDLIEPLIGRLRDRVDDPLTPDQQHPFTRDLVVVPSLGVRRWLQRRLSHELGSTGRNDGVVANITFPFPGTLRWTILRAAATAESGETGGPAAVEDDPWHVDRLVWSVLEVLQSPPDGLDERLFSTAGTSLAARAQSIASLFDSYDVHRSGMVQAWIRRSDDGPPGGSIPGDQAWQPELFRRVHAVIERRHGVGLLPSQRLAAALAAVRTGELRVAGSGDEVLPSRLSVFGQSIWGGDTGPVLTALAQQCHITAFVPSPSAATSLRLAAATTFRAPADSLTWSFPRVIPGADRAGDGTPSDAGAPALAWTGVEPLDPVVDHPLLVSWGRRPLETALLLGSGGVEPLLVAPGRGSGPHPVSGSGQGAPPRSVLGSLQSGIRSGRAGRDVAPGSVVPDRTFQVHGAPGRTRQVEVLRDVICDLLEHGLDRGDGVRVQIDESDIAVVCHQLDEFAPLIGSVWGPPATGRYAPASDDADAVTPTLRYSLVDRTARQSNPVLDGLTALLDLVGGRMERSEVLDLLSMQAVANRFDLGPGERELLGNWVDGAGVRWGLDGEHRHRVADLPEEFELGTWAAGLRQLVAGVASGETLRLAAVPGSAAAPADEFDLALGSTAITTVPDGQLQAATRVVEAVCSLAAVVERLSAAGNLPVSEWRTLVTDCAEQLLAPDRFADWQMLRVDELLRGLEEASCGPAGPGSDDGPRAEIEITLGDLRRLVTSSAGRSAVRADLGIGSIAIARPSQLAGVPYRVVCVLGLDAGALPVGGRSGDDLALTSPLVGDRDVRSEARAELLAALTTATEAVVVSFTSHDIRTGADVPRSAVLDELLEAVGAAGVDPDQLVRIHSRQPYDPVNFPAETVRSADEAAPSRSFDVRAQRAAEVVRGRSTGESTGAGDGPFVAAPLEWELPGSLRLEELHRFYESPTERFLRDRLAVSLPGSGGSSGTSAAELPLALQALDEATFGRALLGAAAAAGSFDALRYDDVERPTALVQRAVELTAAQGALPPPAVAAPEVHRIAEEVASLAEVALAAGHRPGPSTSVQVDIAVPVPGAASGECQLVGVIRNCVQPGPDGAPGREVVEFVRPGPSRLLAAAIDLLVLTVQDPDTPWRSLLVTRGLKGASPEVHSLTVIGSSASDRRDAAVGALGSILEQYVRGQRLPLLWFPTTSAAFAWGAGDQDRRKAAAKAWGDPAASYEHSKGESALPVTQLLFGVLDFDDLLAAGDPGSRFVDEVDRSWGALQSVVRGLPGAGGGS